MSVKSKTYERKIALVIVVLIFLNVPLFAYDGTVFGGPDGNFTRYNWIQQASSVDLARTVVNAHRGNYRISKLFSIGEDDVDMEDVQVINDMEAYIRNNYRVGNGDAFSFIVKRSDLTRGFDGWVVLSHYSSTQNWLHYLYYFSVN
jgi:hypothetical protein